MKKHYRKVKVYTKSLRKYYAEKARRRRIIGFVEAGLTQREIAVKLGVSVKTVSRDVARLHSFFERLKFRERRKTEEVLHGCVERIPPVLRLQVLSGLIMAKGTRQEYPMIDALLRGDILSLKVLRRQVQND